MPFEPVKLPYSYDALEPYIDAKTVEIHYSKHHQTYATNLNAALADHPEYFDRSLEDILVHINSVPEDIRQKVRNNAGGVYNHNVYWETMAPHAGGEPSGALADAINKTFGSFDAFKKQMNQAGLDRFGSGWAWLSKRADGSLVIHSTANQDSPWSEGMIPVLGVDVWEHAYYLLYQNRRGDYLTNWWNLVNWEEVGRRFREIQALR